MTRSTRPDRLDRLVLTTLGVLLAAAGSYGLVRGGGGLGEGAADGPLLLRSVQDFVADNQLLFWTGAAMVSLLVAWLGYWWLRAQFPASKTVRQLEFEAPPTAAPASGGEIRLSSAAATQALQDDLEAHEDVRSAKARVLRGRPRPDVELRVGVADDVDVASLAGWIDDQALGRLAQALQVDELTARMEVSFTGPPGRTLR